MAEYIDREKIREAACDGCMHRTCKSQCDFPKPCKRLLSAFMEAEQEDVARFVRGIPVRKNRESKEVVYLEAGKENEQTLYKRYVYTDKTDWVEYCSVCGKRMCSRHNNYCPACGAKMDI